MRKTSLLLAALLTAVLAPLTAHAAAGYLYESDFSTGTIFQFTNPTVTALSKKITFKTGITQVRGLAFDRSGNLFVGQNDRILKITSAGTLSVFASVNGPNFLATDKAENLFASDRDGNILKFTPLGVRSTFAAGLDKPTGLAFDFSGNLFVADYSSNTIFQFTPSGTKSIFVQGLNGPEGLAFDRHGILYVANPGTKSVERFTRAGVRFTRVININSPVGLVFDATDNLFVTDDCNGAGTNSIYKFTPTADTGETFASGLGCPIHLVFEPARDSLLNISTRARVQNDDRVLIGGFIITGSEDKQVIVRALGPSLSKSAGVTDALQDPFLELRDSTGALLFQNDDWKSSQRAQIQSTGLAPPDDLESAILATLAPGNYTGIVRGAKNTTGTALVEVYDLNSAADSTLANLSSRGFVDTGNNVMIGGFIIGGKNGAGRVIVRALGPSLADAGVTNALHDPTLELHNADGSIMISNDDWQTDNALEIYATGLAPPSNLESAIVATLPFGQYTAIVRGLDDQGFTNGTGVGLVEVYNLR